MMQHRLPTAWPLKNLPARIDAITRLGNAFLSQAKYDEAIVTYEKGEKLLEKPGIFSYQLADLYKRNGDIPKMIEQYLYIAPVKS